MKTLSLAIAGLTALIALPSYSAEIPKPGNDIEFIKKAALGVDQHIAQFYRRKKLPVPDVTDDATFMRRAFLVSIGRIPTAEEALAFLEIEDDSKREELVAYLMQSPGYSSQMTNWAFDLLRLRDSNNQSNFDSYRNWIRQAMKDNMAWDEFVSALVGTSGNGWNPETASVGYYTIDRGMPLDNLANTMRIFLGSNMECAQCHDDPFEETERMDFYNLAAFTEGQEPVNADAFNKIYREYFSNRLEDREGYKLVKFIRDEVYSLSLSGGGAGRIKLPGDYQYRDGSPGEFVGGKTPFGKSIRTSDRRDEGGSRILFAEWITAQTGPQFPGVISNRMWERIMGKGIYEPVDEYVHAEKTVYPELTKYVTKLMVDLDYDLRAFQHVLMLTKTFQFATNPNPSTLAGGDDFHGRKIERLAAEQIWDSLITLADGDPDKKPIRSLDTRIPVAKGTAYGSKMDMIEFSKEILALETEKEVRAFFYDFEAQVRSGGKGNKNKKRDENMDMMSMSGSTGTTYRRDDPVRASELPSPAPTDHLLYVFGASGREVVEGASLEPNVGQILAMMNGFVQRQLVNNSGAHLYDSLEGASTDEEKIRRLYVAILSRTPNEEEMGWMMEEVAAEGDEGFRNIVSALVMSSEFLFLQ
ncbi:DUF1549 domain-containing protein [Luteolibacter sp. AS25]|uniref:DUF1549 domain-containing protein n=1 Tax=Luteolibacter sp. AS25 TaxID=3135776 RepID=UPI00398B60D3